MNFELLEEATLISIVGYLIVFVVLVLLYLVFYYIAKVIEFQARQRCKKAGKAACADAEEFNISGDVAAAISMALHLHFGELHDVETGKLTVKRVSKRYTPWNSKIYNVINRL
ncbi:MAG: OadG family protein [Bacteroidales bacterium]|nr:OadG family protein [Bacteroidales bacterium]